MLREEKPCRVGWQAGRRNGFHSTAVQGHCPGAGDQRRNGLVLCRCNCPCSPPIPAATLGPELPAPAGHYLVVGAHVQQDREALLRVDPSARRVQGQLAYGDAHAVAAQVSQAQDALPVGHHHGLRNEAGRHQSPTAPPVTMLGLAALAGQACRLLPATSAGGWRSLSGTRPEGSFNRGGRLVRSPTEVRGQKDTRLAFRG